MEISQLTDYKLPVEAEQLDNYVRSEGIGSHHVDGFDYWLEKQIAVTLSSRTIVQPIRIGIRTQPDYVVFSNIRCLPPQYSKGQQVLPLTPQMAREQHANYNFDVTLSVTIHEGNHLGPVKLDHRRLPLEEHNVCIGSIPLATKSKLCILRGKTPEELMALGEDPHDPPGIFIVGGVEKTILLQEQLTLNRILVLPASPKKPALARMTVNTSRGTTVVDIYRKNAKEGIEIKLPSLKAPVKGEDNKKEAQSVDVMWIYCIYGIVDEQQIFSMIRQFIPEAQQEKCMAMMCINHANFILNTAGQANRQGLAFDMLVRKLPFSEELVAQGTAINEVVRIVNSDLFPNIEEVLPFQGETADTHKLRQSWMRLQLLSAMIARYLQFLAGYRKADKRDFWSNKRTEGAGRMCDQLLRQIWRKLIQDIQKKIIEEKDLSLDAIVGKLKTSRITETFQTSIAGPNWGVKGQNMKQNVSQTLERASVLATRAHMDTIDVGVSRTSPIYEIRLIQDDQMGFVCHVACPDGNNAGLVKKLSLTARVSAEQNDQDLIAFLYQQQAAQGVQWIFPNSSPEAPNPMMINGKYMGWVNAKVIEPYLIQLRRNNMIFLDAAIVFEDDWLTVDLGPSRLIRPLMIVNEKTQELVYDERVRAADDAKNNYEHAVDLMQRAQQVGGPIPPEVTENLQEAHTDLIKASKLDPRKASAQEMLATGVMEYLSCWEQQSARIKLAAYRSRITDRLNKIATTREAHSTAVRDLEQIVRGRPVIYNGQVITEKDARQRVDDYYTAYVTAKKSARYTHCELDPIAQMSVSSTVIPWPNHNQAPRNTYQDGMGKQGLGIYHTNFRNRFDGNKLKVLSHSCRPIVDTTIYRLIGLADKGTAEEPIIAFMAYPENQEDGCMVKLEYLQAGGFRMEQIVVYNTVVQLTGDVVEWLAKPTDDGKTTERYRHIQQAVGTDDLRINGLPKIGAYLKAEDCVIGKLQLVPASGALNNESVFMKVGEEGIVEKINVTSNGKEINVSVKMRITRQPVEGDKFSARNAQKVTIGRVVAARNLPFNEDGITPDIIINPHAIPSRMTLSYLNETAASKAACYDAKFVNGSAFQKFDIEAVRATLQARGQHPLGYEFCRSGLSGRKLDSKVYMGPCAILSLKHQVSNKIQARGQGRMNNMTRQPTKGRGTRGGIRFGEMERDCLISYGAAFTMNERLCLVSDVYTAAICDTCGTYGINNSAGTGYKKCPLCGGTTFGTIREPYIYKLIQQLLATMDIFLRPGTTTWEGYKRKLFTRPTQGHVGARDTMEEIQQQLEEQIDDTTLDMDEEDNPEQDLDDNLMDLTTFENSD